MKPDPRAGWRPRPPALYRLALLALAGAAAWTARAETPFPAELPPDGASARLTREQPGPASLAALSPAHLRWQASLAAFAQNDRQQPPGSDAVLFVGSSTIRLWTHLSQDFGQVPVVINRGFGGSTMLDCSALVRELVLQYKPRQVMVYAGDNDLAEGRTPAQVLQSFADFVRSVRAELPAARISFISIKPSPLRVGLLEQARQANALIARHVQTVPDLHYIDIFSPMLDAQGLPRPELFGPDQLHLNEAGYRLWQSVIAADLAPAPAPAPAPPAHQQQASVGGW